MSRFWKYRLHLTAVLLLIGSTWAPASESCGWPDATVLAAILPVATDHGSYASGVVIGPGRVLTAAHAVHGAGEFFVRVGDQYRVASLLVADPENDIALLAVDTDDIRPLSLSPGVPQPNQMVWAVGFPRAGGMETSSGVFRNMRQGALHTSAPIDSGQSGGGLLSCDHGQYRLLGMLRGFGAYLKGDRYIRLENHSVAVAASTIENMVTVYR